MGRGGRGQKRVRDGMRGQERAGDAGERRGTAKGRRGGFVPSVNNHIWLSKSAQSNRKGDGWLQKSLAILAKNLPPSKNRHSLQVNYIFPPLLNVIHNSSKYPIFLACQNVSFVQIRVFAVKIKQN